MDAAERLAKLAKVYPHRVSNLPCPVCRFTMLKPSYEDDEPNWECRGCDLEFPGSFTLDGESVLKFAATQPSPEAFLKAVNPRNMA